MIMAKKIHDICQIQNCGLQAKTFNSYTIREVMAIIWSPSFVKKYDDLQTLDFINADNENYKLSEIDSELIIKAKLLHNKQKE